MTAHIENQATKVAQFEILFRQAQELTAIARKVTVATTESAKASTKLPDAPLRDSSKRGL